MSSSYAVLRIGGGASTGGRGGFGRFGRSFCMGSDLSDRVSNTCFKCSKAESSFADIGSSRICFCLELLTGFTSFSSSIFVDSGGLLGFPNLSFYRSKIVCFGVELTCDEIDHASTDLESITLTDFGFLSDIFLFYNFDF